MSEVIGDVRNQGFYGLYQEDFTVQHIGDIAADLEMEISPKTTEEKEYVQYKWNKLKELIGTYIEGVDSRSGK